MSTFVLKHFPGMRAEEDYSYVSLAQQEHHLLHLERDNTERIRNQICKLQKHDPIEQSLPDPARDPAAPEFEFADPDELPLSTYTDNSNSNSYETLIEARSSATSTVVAAPPLRVALALDMVPASRGSVGSWVSAMLQGTVQAWTWFHDLLFPRIYFRGRDL